MTTRPQTIDSKKHLLHRLLLGTTSAFKAAEDYRLQQLKPSRLSGGLQLNLTRLYANRVGLQLMLRLFQTLTGGQAKVLLIER